MGLEDDGDGMVNIGPGKSAHDAQIKYDRDQAKRKDELSDSSDLTMEQRKERLDKKAEEMESYMEKNKDRLGPVYVSFFTTETKHVGKLEIPQEAEFLYIGKACRNRDEDTLSLEGYRIERERLTRKYREEVTRNEPFMNEKIDITVGKTALSFTGNTDKEVRRSALLKTLKELADTNKVDVSVKLGVINDYREINMEDESNRAAFKAIGLLE
ncbi:MAG: hypothetical protein V1887_04665 [Candidatus Aenigmatarchaeota archaeon]